MQQTAVGEVRRRGAAPRAESRSEWRIDALVHAVGVVMGLAACAVLAPLAWSRVDLAGLLSLTVYGFGLLAMLGCSAVYNIGDHGKHRRLWRRLDHAAIFVMIAGTYTPFLVLAIDGPWGTGLLVFVWTVAAAGAALKLLHPGWLEGLSLAAYLLLGWIILVALDELVAAVPIRELALLVGGGLLYSTGVLFYLWRRLPYHRAIWHGFVLVAAGCHYFAILGLVIG